MRESPSRRKLAFKLTRSGRRAKATGLNLFLEEYRAKPPLDTESILRIAALAMNQARSFEARGLFRQAAKEYRSRTQEHEQMTTDTAPGVAGIYRFYTAAFSTVQLQAISSLFAELALPSRRSVFHPPASGIKPNVRSKV
jgi:hypothetical protein